VLSKADNEYLCRIGPGTPMGDVMRQYWLPAIRSDELAEADGAPLRRQAQRSRQSFTGIPGIRQQDMAVTESMGPIFDRETEHLGTTDALIIRTRRRMIAAARALANEGVVPPGVDSPELYRQRSGGVILPRDANWWDATEERRTRFLAAPVRS
jgi:hypothetical protein